MKTKKIVKRVFFILLALLFLFASAFGIYVSNYYHEKQYNNSKIEGSDTIKITKHDNYRLYGKENADTGFIFYPGGKVDEKAYEPLLIEIAAKDNVTCVLVKMPLHLAVFDINAADKVIRNFPNIKKWYIGGHSLGGAMAASYVQEHTEAFSGLILLGAYPTKKLPDEFPVLTLYGSNDKVMNKDKYNENKKYAKNLNEYVIQGGNHAWFGYYGEQKGDEKATITHEKQWEEVTVQIDKFLRQE